MNATLLLFAIYITTFIIICVGRRCIIDEKMIPADHMFIDFLSVSLFVLAPFAIVLFCVVAIFFAIIYLFHMLDNIKWGKHG